MCVNSSGNAPTLTCGGSLGGNVLFASLLHRSRKHILLEGMPNVGDGVGFGKPITGTYFGSFQ